MTATKVSFVIAVWMSITAAASGHFVPGVQRRAPGTLEQPTSPSSSVSPQRMFFDQYCVSCHNERQRTAGLMLDRMDVATVGADAEVWEKVVRKLRMKAMPPAGIPRPDTETYEAVAAWLEGRLDEGAKARPNAGRPVLHRLNRTEYANAIRDLLALEIDVAALLPPDDSSHGFDNVADVLKVSPVLLEQYLIAARKIGRLAIGDPAIRPVVETYRAAADLTQNEHLEGLPFGTRGGWTGRHHFPLDGEYEIKLRLVRNLVQVIRGLQEPHELVVSLDGVPVQRLTVGGEGSYEVLEGGSAGFQAATPAMTADAPLHFRLPVKAGPHWVAATFVQKTHAQVEEPRQPLLRSFVDDGIGVSGVAHLASIAIGGPYGPSDSGDTPSRARIFVCRPSSGEEERPCAKRILAVLARRAYRGPVSDADLQTLLTFYGVGRREQDFERGIQMALQRMLASPRFLFRFERDPENAPPGAVYAISDIELASRLSFFLWSSIPDDELLQEAERGRLSDPAVLERQVRRMLTEARAGALVENFAGQWLFLRNLRATFPTQGLFPDFDDNLRQAFIRETELLFESIMREDGSVLDFLNADYTFVNERLARHYGIPNVYGSHFRRVTVTDDRRRGLLGHGSILTVSSYVNRTAPTIRGKWVLENLLNAPPPAPPPNVPTLKGDEGLGVRARPPSMRARMEAHRANPVCASCHAHMDPLGFALENFDAIGQWRDVGEDGAPIDASGTLWDGTPYDGPIGLRQALLTYRGVFVQTLIEKLLTYAVGRGLEYYDAPSVREIVRRTSSDDYRWSSLIMGIVKSTPFQMRTAANRGEVPAAGVASHRPDPTRRAQ